MLDRDRYKPPVDQILILIRYHPMVNHEVVVHHLLMMMMMMMIMMMMMMMIGEQDGAGP